MITHATDTKAKLLSPFPAPQHLDGGAIFPCLFFCQLYHLLKLIKIWLKVCQLK
jgi:hypothetical protein